VTGQDAREDDTAGRAAARGRDLRAARTLALARRREGPQAPAQPTFPYLVCACGEDRIGLPLRAVAQVLPGRPCTPVPGAAPALAGIVALSGRIVGVVGLARALGRPAAAGPDAGHLVLPRGEPPVALAVDRALAIARSTRETASEGDGARPLGSDDASDYVPAADGSPDFTIVDPAPLLRRLMP
jgi:purine-binding chemotaxis protein CheW